MGQEYEDEHFSAYKGYWTHYGQVITSNDIPSNVVTSNDFY